MIPRACLAAAVVAQLLCGQTYDLLLKGGHVLDPANNIDGVMDVAISGNRIARIAPGIPAKEAKKSVDATGLYVTPGLVDLHGHVYVGGRPSALFPDDSALTAGTTTVCDAGISGWRTFEDFKATMDRVFGPGRWRQTSGYRTRAQENALRRAGAGTVRAGAISRHSLGNREKPGAYDAVVHGMALATAADKLRRAAGAGFARVIAEGAHGPEGAHLHVELISFGER